MNGLQKNALTIATNAFDRLFRPHTLIRSNFTPFEIIYQQSPMSLRYYPPLSDTTIPLNNGNTLTVAREEFATPIVIVPPLAATATIFDLLPERSLVRYLRACGYPVYLIDWGEPGKENAHLGIRDYTETLLSDALTHVRQHHGSPAISLLGWCMGGLFAMLYAGLGDDTQIKNIITIASPIDSHQGGIGGQFNRTLSAPAKLIRQHTRFRIHDINPSYLQVPGWLSALSFKLTNPVGSMLTYWDLLNGLADREFVSTHTTTSYFLDNMHDYPGGIIQDFMLKLSVDNDFARGEIQIGDNLATFSRIHSSILSFAGEVDAIVSPAAARKILDLVASEDTQFIVAPGGHAGVVMGAKAPDTVWATIANWLSTRSSH